MSHFAYALAPLTCFYFFVLFLELKPLLSIRVIPYQINAKNGLPPQISTKLGLQVVPHDILAQTKFWSQKLCGFYFTALQKLDFSCIFAVPDHTKQAINCSAILTLTLFIWKCSLWRALLCGWAGIISNADSKYFGGVSLSLMNIKPQQKFGLGMTVSLWDISMSSAGNQLNSFEVTAF